MPRRVFQISSTLMAFMGQTAEQDSQPVQYVGMATLTSSRFSSKTFFGQIRAHAWQLVHLDSSITGMYMLITPSE